MDNTLNGYITVDTESVELVLSGVEFLTSYKGRDDLFHRLYKRNETVFDIVLLPDSFMFKQL